MQDKIEARLRGLHDGQAVEFTLRNAHYARRTFDQALRSEAFHADYDLVRHVQRAVEAVGDVYVEGYSLRVTPPQTEIGTLANILTIEHTVTVRKMFPNI